ncbi:hypothetical protein [Tomitella fengzijianii]|uniref:hypothetical protein n=1 Tax=Tomitella fengzijianii TaxID=2597660 RepID=UPI00131C42B9|nr:hypothetical protein [Tomitella fengzijianii]
MSTAGPGNDTIVAMPPPDSGAGGRRGDAPTPDAARTAEDNPITLRFAVAHRR